MQSQGRLQLYNDNIPFKINLSSQKGIYSDVKAQLSGKYFIKSQKLSAELNSTIDNLKYDKYRVKKSSVKATYSSAKKTKLNLKAQQVLLDLDFLNHPLFAPTVKLRYKDGNLKADKINIKTGEQEYQLSLSSDELTKHFRLELQGEYFNFNSFSIGNSQKKSHKKTKLPIMDINIQCKKVVLSNLIIDDYLGNIQINDQIIYMKNNQGKLWNSKIGFSGEYQLKDNNLSGEYEVNKIDSKTFKRFFGDGFRLDGDILLRGDLQLVNSKYAMTGKFTNKKTVILDQSQLKNSVWNLPFISSQKTKIDTIRNIEGNFSLLFSKDKKEFILASTKANMGEHFVDVSGNINFTTSPTDYDFDIHYYFTEYFKDNYIIISQFFEAIKKINKWSPAEKNHHDQYDNLIKISIKKKAGKRSLKLFDQAKN